MKTNIILNESIAIVYMYADESTAVNYSNVRWNVFLLKVGQILKHLQELS